MRHITVDGIRFGKPETLNYITNQIFDQIDVKRIQCVMELLNWKWAACETGCDGKYHDRVPTKKEMKACVARLIQSAFNEYFNVSAKWGEWQFAATGGFQVALRCEWSTPNDVNVKQLCEIDIDVSFSIEEGTWFESDIPVN